MSHHEIPSIRKEIEKLEGENPFAVLSALKEKRRELDYRDGPDNPSPDDRARLAQLTEQIDQLEKRLYHDKAA